MKLTKKITAAAVLAFIAVFSGINAVSLCCSDKENLPEISLKALSDGSFGRELSDLAAENFTGRDVLISASARLNSTVGESIVNDVFISDDRLIYVGGTKFDTKTAADKFNRFKLNYDGAVYLAAIPTSAGIYGDILPPYLNSSTEKQLIDGFYSELDPEIKKIDAYSILKMLSDNYIYYRSDEKWTSYGAFCVYRTVIQKLGFQPVSYDKYTIRHVTDNFRGNLYSRTQYMRSTPDLLDVYKCPSGAQIKECVAFDSGGTAHFCSLYDLDAVSEGRYDELYLGQKMPLVRITTTVNNDRHLLVIGDEYAACFIPFLAQHYSTIAVVFPQYADNSVENIINISNYEQTLFLFGIDSLNGGESK